MMKIQIHELLYASIGALLCACSTDTVESLRVPDGDPGLVVSGIIENQKPSRAEMSEEGLKFSFRVADADRIGIYMNYPATDWTDHNLCFEASSSTGGWVDFRQVTASTAALQEGLNVYAYSPYLEAQPQVSGSTEGVTDTRSTVSPNWSGTRNIEVPAEQTQLAAGDFSHLTRYYALAAAPTTVYNDEANNPTVKLNFSGIFALLRIRLANDTDQTLTISRVDFEVAENQELTGLYTADLTADPRFANAAYATTPVTGRTGNKASVLLTTPATIAAGSDTYIYMVVHPVTVTDCVITAWTNDGYKFVERKTFDRNSAVALQRDIRRTFRCTLASSNKVTQDAPALNAEGFYEVASLQDILWVSQNATEPTAKYKIRTDLDLSASDQTLQIDTPAEMSLGEGTTLTVKANQIQNNSDLTVSGTGTISGDYGLLINNSGGHLTIDGQVKVITSNNQTGSGILNKGGNIVIEDCTVQAAFYAIANSAGGKLTIKKGNFSSTAHNGNGEWAYCIRSMGANTETVIDYAEVSGVQGSVTVDSGAKLTINDGIFSTYDLSGTGNNFHGLAVLADGHAVVNGGKFFSEGHDYCVRIGDDGTAAATDSSTIELKGGYYGDRGLDKIHGGTTITPAAGYKFVPLDTPLTESSVNVPGKSNTYKYRIVAE